ncbi:MAG: ferrous iron transporter B [Wenzhouxiangellaceae bacterium]|nr:ferrous iron transporter B [Wenzhouxiangellaceae bacterium]
MSTRVMLIGSPNCGKTLLFNRLTGLAQKVANFPGITVELASGRMSDLPDTVLVDYPGTYSLHPLSGDEQVAVDEFRRGLDDPAVSHVVCVVDVTRLEKSLYLTLQVIRLARMRGKHVVIAANMMDVLAGHGIEIDLAALAAELDAPIVPISARTGNGIADLIQHLRVDPSVAPLESAGGALEIVPDVLMQQAAHRLARRYGPRGDVLVRTQNRLDAFFLHSWTGGLAFFLIMYLLFQSIFTGSAPVMDAVESSLGAIAGWLVPLFGPGMVADFTSDALFSGVGAFLVFVPQIFVLTLVVGLLEDTGYMARAALICHRPLKLFGLTGRSFIPMLSGVACAIPGVYAARSIESPKSRRLTYMAIPLMPCSARLPVYTLLIAAFIPSTTLLGGLVGAQGLAMVSIYFFGLVLGLVVAGLAARRTAQTVADVPFVLEMPPYRMPALKPLVQRAFQRCKHFVTKAGGVILSVTIVVWVLGYFPNGGTDLGSSWLAAIGRVIEPLFAPIGLDWRFGVAILTSFLAREVFVGTLGTIFGIQFAEENMVPLVENIHASGLGLASGVALLVFFSIALMCVSTLVILARESGSWRLPIKMFIAYGLAGYIGAVLAYQFVSLLTGA